MADRRQDPVLRGAFDRAVEQAAEQAAQVVGQIHRRRLVRQTAIATALVSLAIMAAVAWLLHGDAVSQSRANAVYDCQLFTRAATTMGDFVRSDVVLRLRQNKTGLTKDLVAGLEKILSPGLLARAQAQNLGYLAAAVKRWNGDAVKLERLAGTDCLEHLGG